MTEYFARVFSRCEVSPTRFLFGGFWLMAVVLAAVGMLLEGARPDGSTFWASHPFFLNLFSALVGFLFAFPFVVRYFRTFQTKLVELEERILKGPSRLQGPSRLHMYRILNRDNGIVGVDSGQIAIFDSSLVDDLASRRAYQSLCDITISRHFGVWRNVLVFGTGSDGGFEATPSRSAGTVSGVVVDFLDPTDKFEERLRVGILEITSGSICLTDPCYLLDLAREREYLLKFDVPSGCWDVFATFVSNPYGGDHSIGKVEVLLAGHTENRLVRIVRSGPVVEVVMSRRCVVTGRRRAPCRNC